MAIPYENLPAKALVNARQVRELCAMSSAVLDRRIKAGEFPEPSYHGRNRVWPWGVVKRWLELTAEQKHPSK